MVITVFGSSSPLPGTNAYQDAYLLGRHIAGQGHVVMNGGYMGTMEAVSRGAVEAQGKVIGVTCDEVEEWRPAKPNPWLTQETRFPTLRQRLHHLACSCDTAVALPGGIGTLAEITYTWNLKIIGVLENTQLWVVGRQWQTVFEELFRSMSANISVNQRALIQFYESVNDVIRHLK